MSYINHGKMMKIYMDMALFEPYKYKEEAVNKYFDSKQEPSRRSLGESRVR